MNTIRFNYGADTIDVDIPDGFMRGDLIQPRSSRSMSMEEAEARLAKELENPHNSPRLGKLAEGKRVGVIVSDEFRAGLQQLIIKVLCQEMARGNPSEVRFFCATGSHEPEVYCKQIEKWVIEYATAAGLNFRFYGHHCDTMESVDLGRSTRGTPILLERDFLATDVRVYGHEAKHHYMAGYSLMDKQVLPGISGRSTIEANHKLSLADDSGPGRNPWHSDPARQKNPFSEDSAEIRRIAEHTLIHPDGRLERDVKVPAFGLEMISDGPSIYWAASGDVDWLCQQAIVYADEQAQFNVDKTRYVIVSPGGPPASQALYGVQNCFDMALLGAIENGGEALIMAPCNGRPDLPPEVSGLATSAKSKTLFWDNLVRFVDTPLEESHDWIDKNFELYIWKTYRVLRLYHKNKLKLYLYSGLPAEKIKPGGLIPVDDPNAWLAERAARNDGFLTAINQGNKLLVYG